jgi:hypothetical protein
MGLLVQLGTALLRTPLLWGPLAAFGCYSLVRASGSDQPLVATYIHAAWPLHAVVCAFFVGVAALLMKAFDIAGQTQLAGAPVLGDAVDGQQPVSDVKLLLTRIVELPQAWQNSYLIRRFRSALELIDRKQSIEGLDAELHHLAARDAAEMRGSYGLVNLALVALPMVAMLGGLLPAAEPHETAANTLNWAALGNALAAAMGLCLALMVARYIVFRFEASLLRKVDDQAAKELIGRFQAGSSADPIAGTVRRMAETVVRATERLVVQQTELWKATVDAAHLQWTQAANTTGTQLATTLATSLDHSLTAHATRLAAQEKATAEVQKAHWEHVIRALVQAAEGVAGAQQALAKQTDSLGRVVDATAQLEKLDAAINGNLGTLAGAQHFEETVMSLTAAIHLITGRLSQDGDGRTLELPARRSGQAA